MEVEEILSKLRHLATADITAMAKKRKMPEENLIGVPTGDIRKLAKEIGKNENLGAALAAACSVLP